jgi:hypothetical protein
VNPSIINKQINQTIKQTVLLFSTYCVLEI